MAMFSSAASNSSRGSASEEGTTGPSRLKNVGSPDGEDERNDFEETHKIQAGIFSVLYVLSKEKMNENLKFTIIKLMFDFTQLFALVVNPAHGWSVDSNSVYWQVLTFSRWNHVVSNFLGYKAYVGILYTITGMLWTALALCMWISYSYKNRSFAYHWPIHVLRIYATIHFGLFDIATLTLIQVSYDCQFLGSGRTMRGKMATFPEKVCYESPHLIAFVVGLATQVLFVVAAVIFFTGEFEVNPISRRFTCCAHSHVEVRAFLLKVAMTVVYFIVGWLQVQTAIQAALCLALTWIFFKNMPYMFGVINHIRVGSYLAVSWAGILAIAILFKPGGGADAVLAYERRITNMMLYGLGPIALLGFCASYLRLTTWSRFVLKRFKEAQPGSKVKDIYRFSDPVEVEIISRVARHWIDDEVLDMDRVKEAEAIIKAGLVLFPTRAFMIMLYSNFLWDVLDNPQAGYSQLQAAKKANPNYMERFAIYRREQEHLARTAQTKGNGESTLDLVSYVEFQRNYRLAMRAHREALVATRNFWQYLLQQHITFTHLSKSLSAIENAIVKADKVYRTVLERYPYSAKMIKSYARFLEGVKNDPWRASKFYTEAEKLEAEREEEAAALELEGLDGDNDSRLLNKVDERVNAVIIINSRGQIQMANKLAYSMFGYNKGELEGKNVAMLMPLPFSQRHNGYIKRHITTGRETVMNRVTDLVALHKDRFVFPFRLAVSKVSGAGDDSLFMGVIMGVEPPSDTANVYILSGGAVAAVDQAFVDWFGYTVEDYLGHPVHTLALDPSPFKRLVEEVTRHDQPDEEAVCPVFLGAKHALIKHKYTDPVDVSLRLKASGLGAETIYRVEMRRNQPPVELVLTNRKGRICFITSPLARILGHTPRTLRKIDIGDMLPQPFGALHAAWIREAAETKPSPHSCRASLTMVLGPTPKTQQAVRLAIKSTDESGEQQHVVKVTPSTLTEGLDERRLRITIDTAGTITQVGSSPTWLFGFKPAALRGRSLADCIDVLHQNARVASTAAVAAGGGAAAADAAAAAELRKLVTLLLGRALERPGTSWRVGVMPPLENIRSLGSIATALLAKQTRPAVMELDVKVDLEDLAAGRDVSINISLWRADLVCGVLEVDKEGLVLTSQDHPFFPSGLLFGVSSPSLLRQGLGRYLQLGSRSIESLFASESNKNASAAKKGALKSSGSLARKVGPLRTMNGFHADGEPLPLTVQLVRKEGTSSRSYAVLHFKEPTRGSRDFLMHLQRGPVEPRQQKELSSDGVGPVAGGVATAGSAAVVAVGSGPEATSRTRRQLALGEGGGSSSPQQSISPLTGLTRSASLAPQRRVTSPESQPVLALPPPPPPQQPLPPPPPVAALPPAPDILQMKDAVGSGSGGSSGDTPNVSTPPNTDVNPIPFVAPSAAELTPPVPPPPPAPLPVPPPPPRVISTPAMDQPRVVGRILPVQTAAAGVGSAAVNGGGAASRWSIAPQTPYSSGPQEPVEGAVISGLTLQDYFASSGGGKGAEDLGMPFDRAAAAGGGSGSGDGSGGGGSAAALRARPVVRRTPPTLRTGAQMDSSFDRRLRERLVAEAAAAADSGDGAGSGGGGSGNGFAPIDNMTPVVAMEKSTAEADSAAAGTRPESSTTRRPQSDVVVQQIASQVPAAAAGLNALSAAVVRATTPPVGAVTCIAAGGPRRLTCSPSMSQLAPSSPQGSPPMPANFSLPNSTTGMLHTDAPAAVLTKSVSGRLGVGGGAASPLLQPPPQQQRNAVLAQEQALKHSSSRDSLGSNSPGQTMRRFLSTKQVSFAPSQLMIDTLGHVQRLPSQGQLGPQLFQRNSGGGEGYNGGAADGNGNDGRDNGNRDGDDDVYYADDGVLRLTPPLATMGSSPLLMQDHGYGNELAYGNDGNGSEEAARAPVRQRSNVKLARIREWVMTEGERYFRLEDVRDIGDTVYPFGPDLLTREDSSHALELNGEGGDPDGEEGDDGEVDAAHSRWAEADGAEDMNELEDEEGALYASTVMVDASPTRLTDSGRGGKDGLNGDSHNHHNHQQSEGEDYAGDGSGDGGGDDGSENSEEKETKAVATSAGQQANSAGAAAVTSSSAQADFRRGKRCRKLLKMLSTPAVQRATLAFRWQALLAIAVQLLANLACFVLLTLMLTRQTRGLTELNNVGRALVSCHDAMLSLQVMDNIYSNRSAAGEGLYDRENITRLTDELKSALDNSWTHHNDVYLGAHGLQQLPSAYNLSNLWNDWTHTELLFYGPSATDQRSTTLWRLGNAFLRKGYELHHRHAALVEELGSLAASDSYKYIHSNGLFELFSGYQLTLNALVYKAVDTSNTINRLQLVLLVIEGCCICALVVAYMAWLLRKVDNQRYGMYGVFLIVPVGLVRGLASKTVAVEEENSDGEEEHHGDEQVGDDVAGGLPTVSPTTAGHGDGVGGVSSGGAGGGIRINMDGGGAGSSHSRRFHAGQSSRLRGLFDRMAFWRLSAVRHGKRSMLRNSKESLWLLAPFVVWGLVVVVMHSLGYVTMEQASAPVAMTNLVNTVLTRVHRVVYFAQELAAAGGQEAQEAVYPVLQQEVAQLRTEWDVMLYGANATQAADSHFALAQRGVAFERGTATNTLFTPGVDCWMPEPADCYSSDHPYAAVVYRGLNAMMQRFFVEADLMLRDSPSDWALNSSRLDYIFHEGTGNMHWAMYALTEEHLARVVALYMRVEVFHVVVFVMSWLLAALFLFGMLRPFMGHTQRETERIAEMLSQLPADVDVEGLLNKALISIKGEAVATNKGEQRAGRNRVAPLVTPFDGDTETRPVTRIESRMRNARLGDVGGGLK